MIPSLPTEKAGGPELRSSCARLLYRRGVSEGSHGELLDASELPELLDIFGEDGVRSYLAGFLEGVDDAMEEEDE